MFTEKFDKFACLDDTISCEVEGFDITARLVYDKHTDIDDCDTHNVDQAVTGCNDEQQAKLLAAREAWFNGEWHYIGVVLSVARNGVVLDKHAANLWGIEMNYPGSDNAYLLEVANQLLPEALGVGRASLAKLKEE